MKEYDNESQEADFLICDGDYMLLAYCPNYHKNNRHYSLSAFLPQRIERVSLPISIKKSDKGYYAYHIIGVLTERIGRNGKVQIGEIVINVSDIPNDIVIGDSISFEVMRIDYSQEM